MPENPLITVIVPTCNRRSLLPVTLDSLARQSCRDFEVIVVNDGEDDVTDIAAAFANAGQNALDITLVKHPRSRRGLPASRNSGIGLARGKYLLYLDDDDVLHPEQLAQLSGFAEENSLPVVYSDYRLVATRLEDGVVRPVGVLEYEACTGDFATLASTNITAVFTVMHRADCLKRSGLFATYLRGHEDWDLWQRMGRHYPLTYFPKIGGDYMCRIDGGSMSGHKKYMGESWLFDRRQGSLMLSMPPVYELEKAAAAPRWLGARAAGAVKLSVILPVGDAAAFLADERALAALAKSCAFLGGAELVLAGFGESMPLLYQQVMKLRHEAANRGAGSAGSEEAEGNAPVGPTRCAWFDGDCGRLLAWNKAAEQAAGEWLLLLEPYVEPATPGWLEEMLALGANPATGAVGPLIAAAGIGRFLGGRPEDGEPSFNLLDSGAKPQSATVSYLPSTCLLLRREIFLEEGGFCINYAPGHYADADLCLRLARRGLGSVACATARVVWGQGGSGGRNDLEQSPAGLIGRRLFWDAWVKAPFALESLPQGRDWSKRPGGLALLWPSEGRMPHSFNFKLPDKFRE